MAVVRVGVKRIGRGTGYDVEKVGDPGVEIKQLWVELNGHRLDGEELGLVRVDYAPGGGDDVGTHMAEVFICVACEGFATVDHREEPTHRLSVGDAQLLREAYALLKDSRLFTGAGRRAETQKAAGTAAFAREELDWEERRVDLIRRMEVPVA